MTVRELAELVRQMREAQLKWRLEDLEELRRLQKAVDEAVAAVLADKPPEM
jgi:hypothetical protein